MFDLVPFRRRHAMPGPFQDMDLFEKFFFGNNQLAEFKTDIRDVGDAYELEADLPGFQKEDIKVDLEGNRLTVRAVRSAESEEKDPRRNYIRRERSYGSFSRSFDVSDIKTAEIAGEYKDGVLKLRLPKRDGSSPSCRSIDIK